MTPAWESKLLALKKTYWLVYHASYIYLCIFSQNVLYLNPCGTLDSLFCCCDSDEDYIMFIYMYTLFVRPAVYVRRMFMQSCYVTGHGCFWYV